MDEPFVGLDPVGVQKLIDILKKWSSERQISMLISSHQLGELEALCNRYIYIEGGKLEESFIGKAQPSLVVHLNSKYHMCNLKDHISQGITLRDGLLDIPISVDKEALNDIFGVLASESLIESIEVKENHLKEVFMKG